MTTVSKFPLLQLPDREILRTVHVMDFYKKMTFSLISKRCKRLVQSIQIKVECISVTIREYIHISVFFSNRTLFIRFGNCIMRSEDRKKRLRAPQWVEADIHRLERTGFKYSDWLKHFQDIFHCPSIKTISFFQQASEYDLDDIKKVFGATKVLRAQHTGCYAYNSILLQKILPIEKLNISSDMFEDSKIPLNILQQNYDAMEIECDDNTNRMTLNELLVMSSKKIIIKHVRIYPQDLNKFIKLWIKGSNFRMEYLSISFFDVVQYDRTRVMKGIKKDNEQYEGFGIHRMDIYRMDGTRATVSFNFGIVKISVWF